MRMADFKTIWRQLLALLMCCVRGLYAYCDNIELQNAVYQVGRNGAYNALDKSQWCSNDRPAYKQSGAVQNYLYYIDIGDGWRGWMIGSRLCQNLGGIAAAGSALAPEDVPKGGWEEVFRGDWHYSQEMVAVCKRPLSTSAIVAVAVSGVVLTGVIVGISICCFMKNKTKFTNTVQQTTGNQNSTSRRRHRPRLETVSGQTDSRRLGSSQSATIGPGHAIPSDFVYVAAPPPYEEEYKYLPPPTYDNVIVPVTDPNSPSTCVTERVQHPEQEHNPCSSSENSPPPYSPPEDNQLPNNAHSNPAFDANETV